jgi:hypothetical protein
VSAATGHTLCVLLACLNWPEPLLLLLLLLLQAAGIQRDEFDFIVCNR